MLGAAKGLDYVAYAAATLIFILTCPVVDVTKTTAASSGSKRTSYASMGCTLGE